MKKELPLLDRIYAESLYADLCRFVGYGTKTYRELQAKLELLGEAYGKTKAESAQAHLTTLCGQDTYVASSRLLARTAGFPCFGCHIILL